MQVLGQNSDGTHSHLANVKVCGSLDYAVDYEIKLLAEQPMQGLALAGLWRVVPRQEQASVGALER